ncbi:MAG: DUF1585 domain-containing protein, partial [Myxococcales bacterium]|nr:DUF1585 domain-containing protein [Myxococcales bacterium]
LGAILVDSEAAHACYARQSFRFAMGKLESAQDLCALADIESAFAASGYDVQELLVALVTSPSFVNRR